MFLNSGAKITFFLCALYDFHNIFFLYKTENKKNFLTVAI